MKTGPIANTIAKNSIRLSISERWESPVAGYLFIMPWLLGFILLRVWPMAQSLFYSFTDFNLLETPKWLGIQNYQEMFQDDTFIQSLKVTFTFVFTSVPLKLIFALWVAMLLNQKIKGIGIYRSIIYFPSLIGGSVAISILWRNIWGISGFINQVISIVGFEQKNWINNPDTSLSTLVVLVVWQFGSSMVIFLAGLKQIPKELYEASSIDGASKSQQFVNVTLPMLSPLILFNLVLQLIQSFQSFTQAYIITEGGPIHSTFMYALYLYESAFSRYRMGYASALAWVLLVIVAIITAVIFASSRYWVFYGADNGGKKK